MELALIISVIVVLFGGIVLVGAPYVPTHQKELSTAFDRLYPLSKNDSVVDIGSGDGRVLRAASARGARAVGYELNPVLWALSRALSFGDRRVKVVLRDAWSATFPDDTTVVYAFAVGRDAKRLLKTVSREATRLGRPLTLICYGNPLTKPAPDATVGAHTRYLIAPLPSKPLTV